MSEKSTLRKSIREQVRQLTDELRQQESVVVLEKLAAHPLFQRARTVMLYYSLPGEAFTDWASIFLIVGPGRALDAAGHRMGRGRGYYDRFLSQEAVRTCPKLGICFRCQLCEAVPFETHDVPIDAVLVP